MVKRVIKETVSEYDGNGNLIKVTTTETTEDDNNTYYYPYYPYYPNTGDATSIKYMTSTETDNAGN